MSEDYLIRNCAPTLAGIKTANLFSCPCPDRAELVASLCRLNGRLCRKGLLGEEGTDLPVPPPTVGGGFAPWGGHADFESAGL